MIILNIYFILLFSQGVFSKETNLNKAREHSLLISNRPPFVTILTLVRDAAARLPNGEGTRAEVENALMTRKKSIKIDKKLFHLMILFTKKFV